MGHIDKHKIDLYAFSRVIFELLYNGNYAISNQEEPGNANSDLENKRFLPKYTVEHSIGAFCIHLFNNQQDIKDYYDTIMGLCLATDPNATKDVSESWSKVKNYINLLENINELSNSPYKSPTRENSNAFRVVKDEQGNISFSNDTFQDCADIASRHMINLISYDKSNQELSPKDDPIEGLLPQNMNKEELNSILDTFVDPSLGLSTDEKLAYLVNERLRPWHRIFGDEILNSKREIIRLITENVKDIVPAINNHTSIEDRTKKEWLLHFYMHQALDPKGADADDIITRTFWELVISHMDKDVPAGFLPIKYVKNNKVPGNELEPGFLNSLKLLYNLSYALKGEDPSQTEVLSAAKATILALEGVCNTPQPDDETKEKCLQDALKATLGLFYPAKNAENIEIKLEGTLILVDSDYYNAVAKVTKKITEREKLSFSIRQNTGHASVKFGPIAFNKLDAGLQNFVEAEPSLQPFAYKFRKKLGLNISLSNEKYKQSVKPFYWTILKPRIRALPILSGIKKFVSLEVRKTQFFKNFEALRFLRTLQGEAQNTDRIFMEKTPGCAEANIKIKNKKDRLLSTFIYENYVSRIDSGSTFDFLQNWDGPPVWNENSESYSEEAIERARKVKIIAKDSNGIEYLYTRPISSCDKGEVFILPLNFNTEEPWTIPEKVQINEEVFNVVGTTRGREINVKNINLSPNIKKFNFGSKFPLAESISLGNVQNLTFRPDSFYGSSLKEVRVPDSVTEISIKLSAFENCKSLKTFIFSNNITHLSIDERAFRACTNLKQIQLPANLKTLDIGYVSPSSLIVAPNVFEPDINPHLFSLNINPATTHRCLKCQPQALL